MHYDRWLSWFLYGTLFGIAPLLLLAGGWTTSINAGMAFLDWPLSDGSINPERFFAEKEAFAEHSHRLVATLLGMLSIGLVVWTHWAKQRPSVRWMAWALLGIVIFQGLLGGGRVLLDNLNTGWEENTVAQTFAVAHACFAQVTLCVLITLTVLCSRFWIERDAGFERGAGKAVRLGGVVLCGLLLVQVLLGAVVRHWGVGMAVPYFPHATAAGSWLPANWNWAVAWTFAHRAGAVVLTAGFIWWTVAILRDRNAAHPLRPWLILMWVTLAVQILLGGLVVWKNINAHAATMHHLVGSFLLAGTFLMALIAHRKPVPVAASEPSAEAVGSPIEVPGLSRG